MTKGLCGLLAGVFVSVFVVALAYELLKNTEVAQATARKVSESFRSAKRAFQKGYRPARQRPQEAT